jgi:hypothetical protein
MYYGSIMMTPLQDIPDETTCTKQFPNMQHGTHFETTSPNTFLAVQPVNKTNPNKGNKPGNSIPTKFCHTHGIQFPST